MKRIAIFASGNGSNAQAITEFSNHRNSHFSVALIVSDNADAGVLNRADRLETPAFVIPRKELGSADTLALLHQYQIDIIVLAGYLGLIPLTLLEVYRGKILNIHPALLPEHGGKGMYGEYVHRSVLEQGDKESGITIHIIDAEYDRGQILCQVRCRVEPNDTPQALAMRIHRLEHIYYPVVINDFVERL